MPVSVIFKSTTDVAWKSTTDVAWKTLAGEVSSLSPSISPSVSPSVSPSLSPSISPSFEPKPSRIDGKFVAIVIDDNVIAEMGVCSFSGLVRDVFEKTPFGDPVKTFGQGKKDYGAITFTGYYDPDDSNGQGVLEEACETMRILAPGDLKIYISENWYFTSASGGKMFVTKAKSIGTDKSGLATTEFSVKLARAGLELLS